MMNISLQIESIRDSQVKMQASALTQRTPHSKLKVFNQVKWMLLRLRALQSGTLLLILAGLSSCSILSLGSRVPITQIREIQQKATPSSTVYVQGQVVKEVPLLSTRAYELQDDTGTIWVVTEEKIPTQDKPVLIQGKVKQKNIRLGTQNLKEVYIEEQKRL